MNDAMFRLEARRLMRRNIADRSERMGAIGVLIGAYMDVNETRPDEDVTRELADYILHEELTDSSPYKLTHEEYSILSANQSKLRSSREKPLSYVADSVPSDNVNVIFYDTAEDRMKYEIKREVAEYREINRKQPVTTYNLRGITGDEAFNAMYPVVPRPYALLRGEAHVEWSLDVRRRDEFTCQKCGNKGGTGIVAHHIEAYNVAIDLRYDVSNGMSLCRKCHRDFHSTYGYGDNTRSQLDDWMGDSYYEI